MDQFAFCRDMFFTWSCSSERLHCENYSCSCGAKKLIVVAHSTMGKNN